MKHRFWPALEVRAVSPMLEDGGGMKSRCLRFSSCSKAKRYQAVPGNTEGPKFTPAKQSVPTAEIHWVNTSWTSGSLCCNKYWRSNSILRKMLRSRRQFQAFMSNLGRTRANSACNHAPLANTSERGLSSTPGNKESICFFQCHTPALNGR